MENSLLIVGPPLKPFIAGYSVFEKIQDKTLNNLLIVGLPLKSFTSGC